MISDELGTRITHREPLHFPETNMSVAPDAILRFKLIITAEGTVDCVSVEQGHPILASVALESLRHWRFRPLVIEGKPVAYGGTLNLKGKDFE